MMIFKEKSKQGIEELRHQGIERREENREWTRMNANKNEEK